MKDVISVSIAKLLRVASLSIVLLLGLWSAALAQSLPTGATPQPTSTPKPFFRQAQPAPSSALPAASSPAGLAGYLNNPEALKTYKLRPGDSVTIRLQALPDVPQVYTVRADGSFYHPVIGEVTASGLTLAELRKELKRRFTSQLINPTFKLGLYSLAPMQVTALGEVSRKGPAQVPAGATILDVLAAVGGVTPQADPNRAYVIRGSKQIKVSLNPPPPGQKAFAMQDGDIFYVYPGKSVSVTGEVQSPGIYAAGENDTPRTMLAKAGGAKPDAALRRVKLVRASLDKPLILDLRPDTKTPLPKAARHLQQGDTLMVDVQQAAVLGAGGAKMVPLKGGDTLIEVLASKGISEDADLSQVAVIRASAVREARKVGPHPSAATKAKLMKELKPQVYDVGKYFNQGEVTAAVPIHDGDMIFVPQKGKGFFDSLFGGRSFLDYVLMFRYL